MRLSDLKLPPELTEEIALRCWRNQRRLLSIERDGPYQRLNVAEIAQDLGELLTAVCLPGAMTEYLNAIDAVGVVPDDFRATEQKLRDDENRYQRGCKCGETRTYACASRDGDGACLNCRSRKRSFSWCQVCESGCSTVEGHALGRERYDDERFDVCLNCHRVLSEAQRRHVSIVANAAANEKLQGLADALVQNAVPHMSLIVWWPVSRALAIALGSRVLEQKAKEATACPIPS